MDLKILKLTYELNKLDEANLSLLINSLNLEDKKNKIENIKQIQKYLKGIKIDDYENYEGIIKQFIEEIIKENNSKFKNKKCKKRFYNEILSTEKIEEKKKILIIYLKKFIQNSLNIVD